MFNLRIYICN